MGLSYYVLMDVTVAYWMNGEVVEITGPWEGMRTEGVLWVDLPGHRLQGMDNYWMDETHYGTFNDPENRDMYEGPMAERWRFHPRKRTVGKLPLEGTHVVRGVMLSDEDARSVGLL